MKKALEIRNKFSQLVKEDLSPVNTTSVGSGKTCYALNITTHAKGEGRPHVNSLEEAEQISFQQIEILKKMIEQEIGTCIYTSKSLGYCHYPKRLLHEEITFNGKVIGMFEVNSGGPYSVASLYLKKDGL